MPRHTGARYWPVSLALARARGRLRVRVDRHFFFEKNRPATFAHPFYSFIGDWVMYRDTLTGKRLAGAVGEDPAE